MKLEVGKYYKDRSGNIVGPMENNSGWEVNAHTVDRFYPMYLEDGTCDFFVSGSDPAYDLIEEVEKPE